jgi:hypothetical protein
LSKTKTVHYMGRSFWVYDVALGVFLKYLIDAAEASDQANASWLSALIPSWRQTACIGDIGLTLDADWTAEQRRFFTALAEEACVAIEERVSIPAEEMLAWHVLDDEGIFPRGAKEVFTAPIVELGRAVIALISGTLPEAPRGKAWLFGVDSGREELSLRS